MTDVSISIGAVMKPAGFEASEGMLSAGYLKDASDPQWKDDEGMKKFMAFIDKYMPGANIADANLVYGYAAAQTMVQVLKQAGDDLTRENVMKQAASLKDFAAGHADPRHQDQHLGHRFRPDRTAQDDAVQERQMGTVRRHHQRRDGGLGLRGLGLRPGASWFETRGFAALLTMRVWDLMLRARNLILRSIAKRCVSKDEATSAACPALLRLSPRKSPLAGDFGFRVRLMTRR